MTTAETAERLNTSPAVVRVWVKRGLLARAAPNLFDPAEVERFAATTRPPGRPKTLR